MDNYLEKFELFFSASHLPLHFHTMSTTYPFLVVYEMDVRSGKWIKLGRTDKVNDLNPIWTQSVVVNFLFELKQQIKVAVFHADGSKDLNDESKHRPIGEVIFELSQLATSHTKSLTLPVYCKGETRDLGNITIKCEAKADTRDLFCVTFSANNLVNKEGFFSTSDPFLVFLRCNEDGSYTKVWESAYVKNSLNPRWAQAKISMSKLCNGDIHRPLRIEIYDYERSGRHVFMGQVAEVSVHYFVSQRNARMNVIEPDKQKKKSYVNSGILQADDCSIEKHYSFTQYIQGGLEIGLTVAIDFTGSNGDPRTSDSLHYIHPRGEVLNEYEQAIVSVGKILEAYDHDKLYPVYGFGARLKNAQGVFDPVAQHCFPIYGGGVEVQGVDGILKAYRDAISNVLMSGPTLFAPLLNTVAATVESHGCTQDQQKFTILLILTDGCINDMQTTMQTLIRASHLPLSVVIVGVGKADFGEMKRLDSDGGLLTINRETAVRDIVQFVPFREAAGQGLGYLAQELLAEIPTQVIQYMEGHKILPKVIA